MIFCSRSIEVQERIVRHISLKFPVDSWRCYCKKSDPKMSEFSPDDIAFSDVVGTGSHRSSSKKQPKSILKNNSSRSGHWNIFMKFNFYFHNHPLLTNWTYLRQLEFWTYLRQLQFLVLLKPWVFFLNFAGTLTNSPFARKSSFWSGKAWFSHENVQFLWCKAM